MHRLVRNCVREAMAERRWLAAAGAPGFDTRPAAGAETRAPSPSRASPDVGGRGAAAGDWVLASQPPLSNAEAVAEGPTGERPEARPAGPESDRVSFGSLRIVGQLLASYLLVEGKQGLLLVDQHAAHERVLYERLRAQWLDHGVSSQPLLVPETIEIEPLALTALLEAGERIRRLGFEVEAFGEDAVLVRAIPALLAGRNPVELVRGLARELQEPDLAEEGGVTDTRLLPAADRIFATLACHAARRFGDHLERGEQQAILSALDEIPWAPTCPHGRPVAVSLDVAEIERRFGRR